MKFGNQGKLYQNSERFLKEPIPNDPFSVPRFTLTTYQPTWVISHYAFCLKDGSADNYLRKPFFFQKYMDSWEAHCTRESLNKEDEELSPEMQKLQTILIKR